MNLFIDSSYENDSFSISQSDQKITIDSKGHTLSVRIRIPEYVENFCLSEEYRLEKGYAIAEGVWDEKNPLQISFDTPIRRIYCNPKVLENHNKVAVMQGPFVLCAEGIDNDGDVEFELAEVPCFQQ